MKPYQERMLADLRSMGIQKEDSLLVHSSFKSLGWQEGTPSEALEVLKEAVCDGTLMLPTLSYRTVGPEHPYFDVNETPCCVGILPETFRRQKDVYRSGCPTHSIAVWGRDAREIAEAHLLDYTPVGPHSPLAALRDRKGKILMLGCSLRSCTSMHGVEELSIPDYLFNGSATYTITLADGRQTVHELMSHGFAHTEQRYDRMTSILSAQELRSGRICEAESWLIDAQALWQKADAALRENPHAFVEIH